MIPLVELPTIVEHYTLYYTQVFCRKGWSSFNGIFQRYISGLVVCENKAIEGINRLCVFVTRNHSSLNRLLTPVLSA